MPKSVRDEIHDCYKHAEVCGRQAAEQTDPKLRKDFLALEAAWLKLARLRQRDLSDRIRERAYEIASLKFCCAPAGLSEGKVGLLSYKHVIWTTVI